MVVLVSATSGMSRRVSSGSAYDPVPQLLSLIHFLPSRTAKTLEDPFPTTLAW